MLVLWKCAFCITLCKTKINFEKKNSEKFKITVIHKKHHYCPAFK